MGLQLLTHLADIAPGYDGLVCDVWGVLCNGATANAPACAALKTFREKHGRVILLSNAPRPASALESQLESFGVPFDCYDTIVTSGAAAREDLARRRGAAILHLGPARNGGLFEGLDLVLTDLAGADLVLCSGLYDDETETPDDYAAQLAGMKARALPMLCANPDVVVQRDGKLVFCAGALAQAYERIGGKVVYYGKPHGPIYDHVRAVAGGARRLLAIGDGIATDIKGANAAGMDVVFVADGIHGEDVGEFSVPHLSALFERSGVHAVAAMRALVW